jgi:ribosomal protein S18 acetylase RimI-like enzyme
MKIRKVRNDEWAALQILNNEVSLDNARHDPDIMEDWALSESGKKYFENLVKDESSVCFIAENDSGASVGYLAASPQEFSYRETKYLEVDNMGVILEYRSQGIGAKLLDECKVWAKQNGYKKLYVKSFFDNKKAISFYKNSGFKEIDVSLELDVS